MSANPAPHAAGICPSCEKLVLEGVPAQPVGAEWLHAACAAGKPQARKPRGPRKERSVRTRTTAVRRDGRRMIEATKPSRCQLCEWPVIPGEEIVREGEAYGWVHDRCLPDAS